MRLLYTLAYLYFLATVQCGAAQRDYGLCSQVFQMHQYCTSQGAPEQNIEDSEDLLGIPVGVEEMIQQKFDELEAKIDAKLATFVELLNKTFHPTDCRNVSRGNAKTWNETGGIFDVYPDNIDGGVEVFCDLTTDGGGWTVFQRRMDGTVNFYRDMSAYINGFGDKDKEMWLGLETIYQLTKDGGYELRVDMSDWEGNTAYAHYGNFAIKGPERYRLIVGEYSGNAGDSLAPHNGIGFSAKDPNPDKLNDCAEKYRGGWWYYACYMANLNGVYYKGGTYNARTASDYNGIVWYHWKNTYLYSLKTVEMKFRKKN